MSSPLRCWPITPTSAPRWRTRSKPAISHRRSRWRSACDRCGSPARCGGRLRNSPNVCLTGSRSPASSRSPCSGRWRIIDYGPSAAQWHRRLAAVATEIGDQEALTVATGNLFGRALNTRDRDEMRRLRPSLLGLITPGASPRSAGWIHYFLALDAYVDGRLEAACEHASQSAEKGQEINHEVMVASAVGDAAAGCLRARRGDRARGADRGIGVDASSRACRRCRRSGCGSWRDMRPASHPTAPADGWCTPSGPSRRSIPSSGRRASCATRRSPSSGIENIDDLRDGIEPLDHAAALAQAIAWLGERDPGEWSPRRLQLARL